MKVSLVFTPNKLNTNFSELSFREDSVGYIPPISLLSVAAILEKEGVEVQLLDMEAENLSYSQALARIKKYSPDLLGFTLATSSFHPILSWIKKFKQDLGLPVIVGGVHVASYPEETMAHSEIDYLVVGEAEIPLPEFIRAFGKKEKNFSGIKSIGYRENDRVIIDKARQFVQEIDSIPFPSRHLIKNELYANILTRKKNFTAMLSSRGCPFRCAFCDQKKPLYRVRSPKNFVDEIRHNYEKFAIREFDIYDSTFTANKQRVIEICELIRGQKLNVGWTVRSRVDSVNEQVLDALKSAGCHTIMYGIESSDPEILKKMRKGISIDMVRKIVSYTKKVGIDVLGFFMFGFPGETRQTIEKTIQFSLELPLDYVQYSVLVPFADTEIYEHYMQSGLGDYWSKYTLDPAEEHKIELVGTGLSRKEAAEYVGLAYRKFYFRPRIIWKRATHIASLSELKRLVRGAYGIFKNASLGLARGDE